MKNSLFWGAILTTKNIISRWWIVLHTTKTVNTPSICKFYISPKSFHLVDTLNVISSVTFQCRSLNANIIYTASYYFFLTLIIVKVNTLKLKIWSPYNRPHLPNTCPLIYCSPVQNVTSYVEWLYSVIMMMLMSQWGNP